MCVCWSLLCGLAGARAGLRVDCEFMVASCCRGLEEILAGSHIGLRGEESGRSREESGMSDGMSEVCGYLSRRVGGGIVCLGG